MSRRKLILSSVIVFVLFVAGGLFFWKQQVSKTAVSYLAAPVTRSDIEERVLATGVLYALKTVEVGAQVSGQLKKLHVALGDKVKAGQLLAEIDPVLQQNTLKESTAQIDNLQAQKRSKQALLRQYELALQRQKQMAVKDAAPKSDLESAQAQLDSTRAEIAALDAQIAKARIAVDTAKANLGYTRITAPMDGVVISIVTEEGQTVVSAQAAPTILKLANLNTITVKAQISEADVTKVKPGQTAYFTTLGDSTTRHYGTLRAIEPGPYTTSTSSAVYYNGLFEVPNPDGALRVSMTAQVSIVLNQAKQVLSIPSGALGEKGPDGRYQVQVLRAALPELRRVRIGINNHTQAQVLEGLQQGEQVVIGDSASLPKTEKTSSMPPGPPPGGRR